MNELVFSDILSSEKYLVYRSMNGTVCFVLFFHLRTGISAKSNVENLTGSLYFFSVSECKGVESESEDFRLC